MHSLSLRVSLQTSFTKLTSNTTLLNTTEGHTEIRVIAGVNPNHTGLDLTSNTMSALNILREDSSTKTVGRIISPSNGLTIFNEGRDHNEWTEYFLAVDAHVILDIREDSRFDEEALSVTDVLVGDTASGEGRAFGLAALDVGEDTVVLGLCDLGSLEGVVGEGVSDLGGGLNGFLEEGDELIVDGVVDEDSGGCGADLALVVHNSDVGPFSGLFEVGVAEDDKRGLSTSLQGNVLHCSCGHLHDFLSGGGGAGERDLVDIGVLDEGRTSDTTVTVKDVHDTRRESGLLEEGSHVQDGERGLFGGFEDNGVTAGQSGTEFPGSHGEREVPGDDLADDTDGLAEGVGEFLRGGADGLAVDLVGPAGVVTEGVDYFAEVIIQGDLVRFS